jgi:hypothetical protein
MESKFLKIAAPSGHLSINPRKELMMFVRDGRRTDQDRQQLVSRLAELNDSVTDVTPELRQLLEDYLPEHEQDEL